MISVCFQGKPFSIPVIHVYAPTSNAEEAEVEWFYEDLQDLLELTPPKRCPFHHRGLEFKNRKSRDTWSNRQILPWSTKWNRAKANRVYLFIIIFYSLFFANRVLPRECIGHSKHPLPTTQEKTLHMDITRWSIQKQIDYILCSSLQSCTIWRSSIQSGKTRLGADCGSDHELLIA